MTATPSKNTALYFDGANPTADIALFRPGPRGVEVLLIKRSLASAACPGLEAFPGGFQNSATHSGAHMPTETPEQTARRELTEETGLVAGVDITLTSCGVWDARWRDPRNDATRFARSHLYCAMAPEGFGPAPQGLDDAEYGKTAWVALTDLAGVTMAFDHGCMLSAACAALGLEDPGARSFSLDNLWASTTPSQKAATPKESSLVRLPGP